jgi:hypothetical protein
LIISSSHVPYRVCYGRDGGTSQDIDPRELLFVSEYFWSILSRPWGRFVPDKTCWNHCTKMWNHTRAALYQSFIGRPTRPDSYFPINTVACPRHNNFGMSSPGQTDVRHSSALLNQYNSELRRSFTHYPGIPTSLASNIACRNEDISRY